MKIGEAHEIDGELYYIESIARNQNDEGTSYSIFLVDEAVRNRKIMDKANARRSLENQGRAVKVMERAQQEFNESDGPESE